MIRAHQPVENHMIIGPCFDISGCDEAICHFCQNIGSSEDYKQFYDGYACENCSRVCEACGDWLMDQPSLSINRRDWHKACAIDAGYVDEDERQAAFDAHIDFLIDERREERRTA